MSLNSYRITQLNLLRARAQRLRIKLRHLCQIFNSHLLSHDVAIWGAYNTSNIGDLALAFSLMNIGKKLGIQTQLCSYSGLKNYRFGENVIIGGGGIINMHKQGIFNLIVQSRSNVAKKTAMVGVDGDLFADEINDETLEFIRNLAFISVRSRRFRDQLVNLTGREDILYYPDLAFALSNQIDLENRTPAHQDVKKQIVSLSISPQLLSIDNRQYISNRQPSQWYRRHFPQNVSLYASIGSTYTSLIRGLVQYEINMGNHVQIIPFTIEDDTYARTILRDYDVEYKSYTEDLSVVLKHVAMSDRMIATRYHAHIFALSLRVPLLSIAYAPKCEDLWNDLELKSNSQITVRQIANDPKDALEQIIYSKAVHLPAEKLRQIAQEAIRSGIAAYHAL